MGSKQALSNGNETEELTDMVEGFQEQNRIRVVITVDVMAHRGIPQLRLTASALPADPVSPEASGVALANATVWSSDYKLLMGAFSQLLYALDFNLAEAAWGNTGKPKA